VVREKTNKKKSKLITTKEKSLMKEKTRVLLAITAVFVLAVIVVAFGSFIESQKTSDLIPTSEGKEIQIKDNTGGKLELEESAIQDAMPESTIAKDKIKEQTRCNAIKLSE